MQPKTVLSFELRARAKGQQEQKDNKSKSLEQEKIKEEFRAKSKVETQYFASRSAALKRQQMNKISKQETENYQSLIIAHSTIAH